MKKSNLKRVPICTLFIYLITLLVAVVPAMADDPGYDILNFTVDVVVDEARAYHITETIEVDFDEERQGIIREIPIEGDAETYEIDEVMVHGDPFTKERNEDSLVLRIGQKGVYQTGVKTYTIEYTLRHFQDYYSTGDYIYLNLIGSQWDTDIHDFSGRIVYPENASFDRLVVTSGDFGATDNEKDIQTSQRQNAIYFKSTQILRAGESVTANIRLNEGAFPDAPAFVFPYTINQFTSDLTLTKEKELLSQVQLELTLTQEQLEKYGQNITYTSGDTGGLIKDVSILNDPGMPVTINTIDETSPLALEMTLPGPGTYALEFSYTSLLPIGDSGGDSFFAGLEQPSTSITLPLLGQLNGPVEEAMVTLNSQVPFSDTDLFVGRMGDNPNYAYDIAPNQQGEGQTLFLQTSQTLYPGEGVSLYAAVDPDAFGRPFSIHGIWPIVIGLIGAMLVFLFLQTKGRDQTLAPVVALYPPDGLSSPEAGYILNKKATAQNMITILYNWANLGYIKISETAEEDLEKNKKKKKKQEELIISKVKDIDPLRPQYEITLFNQLFARGTDGVVTSKNLENKFYKDVQSALYALINRFNKGEKALYKKNSGYVLLSFVLGALPLILLSVISAKVNHSFESLFVSLGCSLGAYVLFFGCWSTSQKASTLIFSFFFLLINVFSIPIWLGAFGLIPLWVCLVTLVLSTLIAFMAAFLPQRTPYGQQITQELLGFKNFIEAAEKDRLEALIEEDPAYFYNVLPYAQVFGLTKIWTDKFQNILLPPPDWYDSSDPWDTAYTMVYISRMQNAMTRFENSAVSSPQASQSHGSFSGSGGSSFSGGGFSGGGSGGGGGSSW